MIKNIEDSLNTCIEHAFKTKEDYRRSNKDARS